MDPTPPTVGYLEYTPNCSNCSQTKENHGPEEKCFFDSTSYVPAPMVAMEYVVKWIANPGLTEEPAPKKSRPYPTRTKKSRPYPTRTKYAERKERRLQMKASRPRK